MLQTILECLPHLLKVVVAVDLEKQEENKSNKNKSVDEVQSVKFDDLNY
jgi:hypothetical protein